MAAWLLSYHGQTTRLLRRRSPLNKTKTTRPRTSLLRDKLTAKLFKELITCHAD